MERISISGYIESESYWEDVTSLQSVQNILDSTTEKEILLVINSMGGDAFAGLQIHDAISAWRVAESGRTVKARVIGNCMSAATLVMMAAKDGIDAYPHAQFLIHQAWTVIVGNKTDIEDTKALLEQIDKQIADLYKSSRGIDVNEDEEAKRLFENEVIFTSEKAKEIGLIDTVLDFSAQNHGKEKLVNVHNYLSNRMDILEKLKNAFIKSDIKNEAEATAETALVEATVEGEGKEEETPSLESRLAALENTLAEQSSKVAQLEAENATLKAEKEAIVVENNKHKAFFNEVNDFYTEATKIKDNPLPSLQNNASKAEKGTYEAYLESKRAKN